MYNYCILHEKYFCLHILRGPFAQHMARTFCADLLRSILRKALRSILAGFMSGCRLGFMMLMFQQQQQQQQQRCSFIKKEFLYCVVGLREMVLRRALRRALRRVLRGLRRYFLLALRGACVWLAQVLSASDF